MQAANKNFYRSFFAIVIPIAIQNLINSAVGMADTTMLGLVSQTAMASSSLAGQIHFLLNMVYGGLAAGITMLAAQYWGRKNLAAIEHILAIGVKLAVAVGLVFFVGTVFFPQALMRIYTNDPAMIEAGAQYLNTVGWSYLFMGFSHPYLSVMKSIERVKVSTLINSSALLGNIVLNAVFIFGWIPGVPPMGIRGVALATVISRVIELALCLVDGRRVKQLRLRPGLFLLHNKVLWRDFIRYSLPAIGNEFVWGLAYSMYSVIMGRLGEDLVAANSIVSNIRNLASVLGFGVANGAAILLGKTIGVGDMAGAERDAKRLLWLTCRRLPPGQRGDPGGPPLPGLRPEPHRPGQGIPAAHGVDQRGLCGGAHHEHLLDLRHFPGRGRFPLRLPLRYHRHVGRVCAPGLFGSLCVPAAAHGRLLYPQPGRVCENARRLSPLPPEKMAAEYYKGCCLTQKNRGCAFAPSVSFFSDTAVRYRKAASFLAAFLTWS